MEPYLCFLTNSKIWFNSLVSNPVIKRCFCVDNHIISNVTFLIFRYKYILTNFCPSSVFTRAVVQWTEGCAQMELLNSTWIIYSLSRIFFWHISASLSMASNITDKSCRTSASKPWKMTHLSGRRHWKNRERVYCSFPVLQNKGNTDWMQHYAKEARMDKMKKTGTSGAYSVLNTQLWSWR